MIRLGITASSGVPTEFDPASLAFFAAMTAPPSENRKEVINSLIVGLKAASLWTKLDWLLLLASHNAQASLINAKNPAKSASGVSSPTFTVDRGYTGNGSSSYVTTGEVLNFAGNVFALDSGFLYAYVNQDNINATQFAIGTISNETGRVAVGRAGQNATWKINNSSPYSYTASGKIGGHLISRTASTSSVRYLNGVSVSTNSGASTSVSLGNAAVLSSMGEYSADRVGAAAYGSGMNATEAQNFDTLMTAYLTAVGAN